LQVRWDFQLGDFPAWLERLSPTRREGEVSPKHSHIEPLNCSRRPEEAQTLLPEFQMEPPHVGCYGVHGENAPICLSSDVVAPDAIFFDAFSPAKNPGMWTLPVFEQLARALDPARPCALTTYSRSTMIRATLLLAGWFVGVGHATGRKEETTIAANSLELITEPLDARWLARAARSDSAEPLRESVYSRAPIAPGTLAALQRQPQFMSSFAH
jgi:hypothetical protein